MCNSIRGIIHIADLHIDSNEDGMLSNDEFKESLFRAIKEIKGYGDNGNTNIDTLVVNGDIVDKGGSVKLYKKAAEFLQNFIDMLDIKHLIIVPGNHDVSRNSLIGIKDDEDRDKNALWKYKDVKFKYFNKLNEFIADDNRYENIYQMDTNNCIVSKRILYDDKIMILGVSSVHMSGEEDKEGFIDKDALANELEKVKNETSEYEQYLKIVAFHHVPISYESDILSFKTKEDVVGTFNKKNWIAVKRIFNDYKINVILTGHVHGNQALSISECSQENDSIYYSTVGSLGTNFNKEMIGLLGEIDSTNLDNNKDEWKKVKESLINKESLMPLYNYHNSFSLIKIENTKIIVEEQYKFFKDEGRGKWLLWDKKFPTSNVQSPFGIPIDATNDDDIKDNKTNIKDCNKLLIEKIKDYKLYKTGHFHWGKNRTLGWIDTTYLLNKRKELYFICKAITDIYGDMFNEAQCVVGIGIKGNIIMSGIRYRYQDKDYTYYPETEDNYNEYEKQILDGEKKYSNIVILTDVVYSGNTVKRFMQNNDNIFTDDCNVNVVCILKTNKDSVSLDIQDYKINFHELCNLKVPNCPVSTNCSIYKQGLVAVQQL